MTVNELKEKLQLTYLCGESVAPEKEIDGCYCGDLLSWVMSRAESGNIWLTVMGNVNSIGVAVLADVACILLTENSAFDDDAKMRAEQNGVIVLRSGENAFDLAVKIAEKL